MNHFGIDIIAKLPLHIAAFCKELEDFTWEEGHVVLGKVVWEHKTLPVHHIKMFMIDTRTNETKVVATNVWHPDAESDAIEAREEDWRLIYRAKLDNMGHIVEEVSHGR